MDQLENFPEQPNQILPQYKQYYSVMCTIKQYEEDLSSIENQAKDFLKLRNVYDILQQNNIIKDPYDQLYIKFAKLAFQQYLFKLVRQNYSLLKKQFFDKLKQHFRTSQAYYFNYQQYQLGLLKSDMQQLTYQQSLYLFENYPNAYFAYFVYQVHMQLNNMQEMRAGFFNIDNYVTKQTKDKKKPEYSIIDIELDQEKLNKIENENQLLKQQLNEFKQQIDQLNQKLDHKQVNDNQIIPDEQLNVSLLNVSLLNINSNQYFDDNYQFPHLSEEYQNLDKLNINDVKNNIKYYQAYLEMKNLNQTVLQRYNQQLDAKQTFLQQLKQNSQQLQQQQNQLKLQLNQQINLNIILQSQVADSEKKLLCNNSQLQQYKQDILNIQPKLEIVNKQFAESQQTIHNNKIEVNQLQQKLKEKEQHIDTINNELSQSKQDYIKLQKLAQKQQLDNDNYKKLQTQYNYQIQLNQQIIIKSDNLNNDVMQLQESLQQYQQKFKILDLENKQLKQNNESLIKQNKQIINQNDNQEQKQLNYDQLQKNFTSKLNKYNEQIVHLNDNVNKLEQENQQYIKQVKQQQHESENQKQLVTQLENVNKDLKQQFIELKEQNNQLCKQIKQLELANQPPPQQILDQYKNEIQSLNTQLTELTVKQCNYGQLTKQNKLYEVQISDLLFEIEKLKKYSVEYLLLTNQLKQLTTQLQQTKLDNQQLLKTKEQNEIEMQKQEQLQKQLQQQTQQLLESRNKTIQLESTNQLQQQQNDQLQKQLNSLQNQFSQLLENPENQQPDQFKQLYYQSLIKIQQLENQQINLSEKNNNDLSNVTEQLNSFQSNNEDQTKKQLMVQQLQQLIQLDEQENINRTNLLEMSQEQIENEILSTNGLNDKIKMSSEQRLESIKQKIREMIKQEK